VELVRALGADHVIDYTREDFTRGGRRYDFILDNVGNHSLADTRRALTPDGRLQSNGGGHADGRWIGLLGPVIRVLVSSLFARQQLGPSTKFQNREDLVVLKGLVEAGKLTPVIDATYPLSGTPAAIGHVGAGHARGTVVIALDREEGPC
jgi:NADPH:quinone reductase-like Zn-dependent oxidoreductase